MNAFLVATLLLFFVLALLLVVQPFVGRTRELSDPEAAERTRLEAQLGSLTHELATLTDETRRPELENRAARTLRALDTLPPAPAQAPRAWLLGGVLAALLLVGVGMFTFVPRWQLAALDSGEQLAVQKSLALPALERAARQSGAVSDYLTWGDAAYAAQSYPQAARAYADALKIDTRQPRALRRLGMLLISGQTGRTISSQEAAQAFLLVRTAAQLAPQDPESQLYLGLALNTFGESGLALSALQQYQKLAPQSHDADDLVATLEAKTGTAPTAQTPASRADAIYAGSCATCHGPNGTGGSGPNLHDTRLSRADMQTLITHGKGSMPAFDKLSAGELKGLLDKLEGWQK